MRQAQFLLIMIGITLSAASVRADGLAEPAPGRIPWAEELVQSVQPGPASRLRIADSRLLAGQEKPVALVVADFTYLDPHGQEKKARAKLYLPGALRTDKAKVPLYFVAGYEATDPIALTHVKRGWLVVSPSQVEPNPLVRTANPDTALLHIARSLPFVDDTKVMIGGGSAGGYITLMLAAETFPLAGAAPDVPPMNWGYTGAYFFNQYDQVLAARDAKQGRDVPFLAAVTPMLQDAKHLYGTEYGDFIWFRHSPLSHLATITCPVSALWSTADVLVPMQQVGDRWVRPFEPKEFPEGFTMDPTRLTVTREGRLRLTDVLADEEYEVFTIAVPDTVTRAKPIELPVSAGKRWSVIILNEGPPGSKVGHFKHNLAVSREEFFRRILSGGLAARQLTALKLERMMDRYAGIEWLPTKLKHLDYAESERADVLRGLKTYITADPENAGTFARLYGQLPPAKRVLEPQVMRQLRARPESDHLEYIQVAKDKRGFVFTPSGRSFTPWGLNYGNAGRLIEDFWDTDWATVAGDFRDMKGLGANVVRVHFQFGKFMDGADRPNPKALERLGKLLELADKTGLYLDLTGLGCYRKADVPKWYDSLSEEARRAAQARFWGAIAERCAKSPAVFCYDLMNEPFAGGGDRKPGEWYAGKLADLYFVQFIALDVRGRPREEVARAWIKRLSAAIRKQDKVHLITVGLLPWDRTWGHLSGFIPEKVAPELDFVSVHIYPEKGKVDEAIQGLKEFAVDKPVVIEETFPLFCSAAEVEEFIKRSRGIARGWMGHYDGMTPERLEALKKENSLTIAQALYLEWLKRFQKLKPE